MRASSYFSGNSSGSCSSRVIFPMRRFSGSRSVRRIMAASSVGMSLSVSYTHLRAHETKANLVCRLLLEKKKKKYKNQESNYYYYFFFFFSFFFFFNDTATTEIYTSLFVGSVRCV